VKRAIDRKAIYGDSQDASGLLDLMVTCQLISASLDEIHVLGLMSGYLKRTTGSDYSAVYRRNGDEVALVELGDAFSGADQPQTLGEVLDITLRATLPFGGWESGQSGFRVIEKGQLTPGVFVFRFEFVQGEEFFIACLSPRLKASLEDLESRLRLLHAQIDVTARNIERYRGVQRLAYVDDATGLYNTRYLSDLLEREISKAEQSGQSFAILFMDLDRFKQVNDGNGHLVGTKILNELGKRLRRYVRDTDTVFRYGGDEFIAVLSPCDLPTAQAVAERIRVSVEKHSFLRSEGLDLRLTVSIGVAVFPIHARSKREIMDAADTAMYTAKKTSRNAVYVADLRGSGAEPLSEALPGLTTDLAKGPAKRRRSK
jgi:diguanylate cyclase (GGDEF)-like protein